MNLRSMWWWWSWASFKSRQGLGLGMNTYEHHVLEDHRMLPLLKIEPKTLWHGWIIESSPTRPNHVVSYASMLQIFKSHTFPDMIFYILILFSGSFNGIFPRKPSQLPTVPKKGFTPQVRRLSAFGSILPILLHDTCVRIQHWIPQPPVFFCCGGFVSKCRFMHWKHCHIMFNRLKLMSVSSTVSVKKDQLLKIFCQDFQLYFLHTAVENENSLKTHLPARKDLHLWVLDSLTAKVMANQDMHESLWKNVCPRPGV